MTRTSGKDAILPFFWTHKSNSRPHPRSHLYLYLYSYVHIGWVQTTQLPIQRLIELKCFHWCLLARTLETWEGLWVRSENLLMPAVGIGDLCGIQRRAAKVFSVPSLKEGERTMLCVVPLLRKLLKAVSIYLLLQATLNESQSIGYHMGVPFSSNIFSLQLIEGGN